MKILLIGPIFANRLHGAEVGIYSALQELGVDVVAYDPRTRLYDDPRIAQPTEIPVEKFSPTDEFDFVLCPGPGAADAVVPLLQRVHGVKVLWNSEPIRLDHYREKVARQSNLFDVHFTFDESEIPLYEKLGIGAYWLPQAFNPDWYKPLPDTETRPIDVCFVGSIGGKWVHRMHLIHRLSSRFKIHTQTVFDARVVNGLYNSSKLVLNLGLYVPGHGDHSDLKAFALQQRIFESCGSGRVCVTNEIPQDTNQLFKHAEHALFYNSENLEEIVEFGLDDSNRRRMESRVREIREQHTYTARLKTMLEVLS